MRIELNDEQSATLREWISDTAIVLHIGEGHSGPGLYASVADMPEEGALLIAPLTNG